MNVHIRWIIRRDMPAVLGIEAGSEFPWDEEDYNRCLRQNCCIGMVAELPDETIVGVMIYELHKDVVHPLKFAVHPEYRRQGVGSLMMRKLFGKLSRQRRNRIAVEVPESNLDALMFFKSLGFVATGICRGFYEHHEDAIEMVCRHEWAEVPQ